MKKFELVLNQSIEIDGRKLFRIKALIDFGEIKRGDLGGYIEKEKNLSQSGDARVYGNAEVKNSPINLINVCQFNVTAYNEFLQIGCKLHTFKEWEKIFETNTYLNLTNGIESYKKCETVYKFCKSLLNQ